MRLHRESFREFIHPRFVLTMLWLAVFGAAMLGFNSSASAAVYEAESATLSGGASVASDHAGYSGTGFVGGFTDANKGNAQVSFNVIAASAGSYTLALRYANGNGATKTLSLYINGSKLKQTTLGATANWDSWGSQTETVTLNAGNNLVVYKYDTSDSGNVNLDNLSVNSASAGPADLIVTAVSWNPASPTTGSEVTLSVTIKNQGGTATPSGVKHGVNFTVDGTQVNWSDTNTASLAAGASITLAANNGPAGKNSWTSTLGTHTVMAYVDDQNLIAESNESNNTLSASMVVTAASGGADLVVTGVTWTPTNPQAPAAMSFSATIKNQGSAATPAGIKHGVSFKVDGVQVTWSDTNSASLAAGASITLTANNGTTGIATWAATSGTHTVMASVDDTNLITETNETNNSLSASLTVSAAPALTNGLYRIRNFWQPTLYLYEAGGKVMYGTPAASDLTSQWALIDQGGHKALWNASTGNTMTIAGVASSADAITTSYTDVSTNALFDVAAGSNSGYWTMRSVAQTSWYTTIEGLKGYAQSYGITPTWGSPQWAFEYVGAVPAKPAAKPDLVVTGITWSPALPTAGQAVTFSATIKNQGAGTTAAGTTNKITFAVNGSVVTSVSNYNSALAAGASITLAQDTGTWAMAGSAPTITATVDSNNAIVESNETNNTFSTILSTAAYGASMPYTTYEAEAGSYTGALISGSRTWGQLSSEASGRAAVQLTAAGQYAQITTTAAGQGLVVRYSIPDTADGSAYNSAISLYVNGVKKADIPLTNKYSWIYGTWGTEGGQKHWSNNPNATPKNPHRFFDEVAVTLDASYPAGTLIKLMRESSNLNFGSTASVTIDLVELEPVPAALSMPSNFVSITSYGATANDGVDDTTAMTNAIAAVTGSGGAKVGVWIPAGSFDFNNGSVGPAYDGTGTRIYLPLGVAVRGAGQWYSVLQGAFAGIFSKIGNNNVSDLKLSVYDVLRDDQNGVSGLEGNFSNSTLNNVWIEHAKVGIWPSQSFAVAGIPTNVIVTNSRIRGVWADGLNFHYGTSNSTASNNHFRGTGDDGMAMWSWNNAGETRVDTGNTFQNNTVQLPGLANGIAIYGGKDNAVKSNLIMDIVDNGSGISFGTGFTPPSFTGTLDISNNKLVRTGSLHHDYGYGIGAIWEYWVGSSGVPHTPVITLNNNVIEDSTYSAVLSEEPSTGATVTHTGTQIVTTGTYGVEIRATAVGAATFNGTTLSGVPQAHLKNNSTSFTVSGVIP